MPSCRVAVFVLLFSLGVALRTSPARNLTETNITRERAAVAALRTKLEKVSGALFKILDPKGKLSSSDMAGSVQTFSDELKTVLRETANASDPSAALHRLRDAQAGVNSLVRDLTMKQTQLMKEGEEQKESLLLGVLMTRQNDPMNKQLAVMQSQDFRDLPVVAAVLKANSTKTPLFQQVAAYLDKRAGGAGHASATVGAKHLAQIVSSLEKRVDQLKKSAARRAKADALEMKRLKDEAAKNEKTDAKLAHRLRSMAKSEHRRFLKAAALETRDINTLQGAADAVKRGDADALKKAMDALQGMLKAMKDHNAGFLVLIETAHRADGRDCPYCAAQCVDKCHAAGRSYVACLTECADAGK